MLNDRSARREESWSLTADVPKMPSGQTPLRLGGSGGPTDSQAKASPPAVEQPSFVRRLVLLSVATFSIAGMGATAVLPYLALHYPLLLVALSPNLRNIVLVASSCNPVLLMVVGVSRRVVALIATYGLGYIYGSAMLEKSVAKAPRLRAFLRTLESLLRRFGAPALLVLPTYTMAGLAGVARTRLAPAAIALTLGQTLWVGASVFFGEAIAPLTARLMAFFSRYMLPASGVCLLLVLVQQVWLRQRSSAQQSRS